MNFKIENSYLNITNYPSVERYLESMASKGWLISKIIVGNIFIFEKIKPQELDFAILPYKTETVGWHACTKSSSLHIYYKEKDSDAIDIRASDLEEFESLEALGKTQVNSYYLSIPLLLFLSWAIFRGMATKVNDMQSGINQIIAPLIPFAIILSVINFTAIQKFLETNKKNIELGKEMEYNNSKFYFTRITFVLGYLTVAIFLVYLLYNIMVLNNPIVGLVFLPIILGAIAGQVYKLYAKPAKGKTMPMTVTLGAAMLTVVMIGIGIGVRGLDNIDQLFNKAKAINREKYKVLLRNDFQDGLKDSDRSLSENISILIPRSYEYVSKGYNVDKIVYISTDYSKSLTSGIAQTLVNRYKAEAIDQAPQEAKTDLISVADHTLWKVDEAYFLSKDKRRIVLRKDKDVFVLKGNNFNDLEVINIAKEKLGL